VCIVLNGAVLTGDTLFPGGPGATRFDHSSFEDIIESIKSNLFTLPDDTVVLPGHGAATTIGEERPQLPAWIERGW
jgi:glyoxylase-like metal-dependent hydrolase (beta-lactamase superfamily II)